MFGIGQGAEDGFGSGVELSVGVDELDGFGAHFIG